MGTLTISVCLQSSASLFLRVVLSVLFMKEQCPRYNCAPNIRLWGLYSSVQPLQLPCIPENLRLLLSVGGFQFAHFVVFVYL